MALTPRVLQLINKYRDVIVRQSKFQTTEICKGQNSLVEIKPDLYFIFLLPPKTSGWVLSAAIVPLKGRGYSLSLRSKASRSLALATHFLQLRNVYRDVIELWQILQSKFQPGPWLRRRIFYNSEMRTGMLLDLEKFCNV